MEKNTEEKKGTGKSTNTTATENRGRARTETRTEPRAETIKEPNSEGTGLSVIKPKPPKKSKPKKKKKTKDDIGDLEKNISMLISTGFDFASGRVGEHWAITEEESKSISTPLASILTRFNIDKTASEYMDFISLVTAVGLITVPRILITQQERKEKGGLKIEKPTNRSNKSDNTINNQGQQKLNASDTLSSLFSEMP